MPHLREVKTCDRCRHFKRRCDLLKPACSRCIQAAVRCSFEDGGFTGAGDEAAATGFGMASVSSVPAFTPSAPPFSLPHHSPSSRSPDDGRDTSRSPAEGQHGLISPTTSTESPEPLSQSLIDPNLGAAAPKQEDHHHQQQQQQPQQQQKHQQQTPSSTHASSTTPTRLPPRSTGPVPSAAGLSQRIIRKRKRNCLSCLRCHRLKVKCDKELPCGRCKSSGQGRECYYSYNKGPNGGKFPCPSAPVTSKHHTSSHEANKAFMATWRITHKFRGQSHWRDLMAKVRA